MKQLTIDAAEQMLAWAEVQNPGPWVAHSRQVAGAAAKIAAECKMDADLAFALGLIHDVGRYKGITAMQHIVDGYYLCMNDGYEQAAQICITHSFPMQMFEEYSGVDDCDDQQRAKVIEVLQNAEYTDYDRLIQLCDSLALPNGLCLMEKRLVDVALRHGANEWMIPKWKTLFTIFGMFEGKLERPLYALFPEIVDNTFGR